MSIIETTGKDVDALSAEEVERLKYELWSTPQGVEPEGMAEAPGRPLIVAEGDSWFDYLPGLDVLDHLRAIGYPVIKVAEGGDTLDNMVFGTEFNRNFSRQEPPPLRTLRLVREHQPKALLFSGGGNDIAGAELEAYLNHSSAGLGTFREVYVDYVFDTAIPRAYDHLITEAVKAKPDILVISHGYGHAIPDGRGVVNLPFGYRFIGPWLRPALTKKNYVEKSQARLIIRDLVDRFNHALAGVKAKHPKNFDYIDLRSLIRDEDWANELHLKNSAFRTVAGEFARRI